MTFKIVNVGTGFLPTDLMRELGTDGVSIPNTDRADGLKLFCSQVELSHGHLGVDLLRLPSNTAFPLHTHPGNHLLLVVEGEGTVTFEGITYGTRPGDLFLVDGDVPHAVGAAVYGAHHLLSFGAPHVELEDPARMAVVANAGGQ